MRQLRKYWLAVAVGLLIPVTSFAQTSSTGSTGSTSTGSSTGSSSSGSISGLTTSSAGSSTSTLNNTPSISAMTTPTTSAGVDSSNILGGFYANPYYQGRAGATNTTLPGGFGTALYGTSGSSNAFSATGTGSSSRTSTTSRTGNTSGTTSRTGGGSSSGFGGANSMNSANSQSGQIIALPRQISYTATLNFPRPVVAPAQLQSDLRMAIDRSSMFANSSGIQISTEGQVVVLRGNVQNSDEARLAEGMIRLTPGVREVRNELKFTQPTPAP